jgi:hypothetical protein
MDIRKALRRDKKISKRTRGMITESRSVFSIQEEMKKRSEEIKNRRKEKEEYIANNCGE